MKNYKQEIFVFGSNLAGIHGAGSAKEAYDKHGAEWGIGQGRTGNAYAIPTKRENVRDSLTLAGIATFVDRFRNYAILHSDIKFNVVKIGCGLAGYTEEQIAPIFCRMPENVFLPEGWREMSKVRGDDWV